MRPFVRIAHQIVGPAVDNHDEAFIQYKEWLLDESGAIGPASRICHSHDWPDCPILQDLALGASRADQGRANVKVDKLRMKRSLPAGGVIIAANSIIDPLAFAAR